MEYLNKIAAASLAFVMGCAPLNANIYQSRVSEGITDSEVVYRAECVKGEKKNILLETFLEIDEEGHEHRVCNVIHDNQIGSSQGNCRGLLDLRDRLNPNHTQMWVECTGGLPE